MEKKPARRELPAIEVVSLQPLVANFLVALKKCKNRCDKRIRLKEPSLPEATVSPALVERCAQAFHVILLGTESDGIFFRKSRSSYEGGNFRMGRGQLFFEIEEELGKAFEHASGRGRKQIYVPYSESREPCVRLTFNIKDSRLGQLASENFRHDFTDHWDGNLGDCEDQSAQVLAPEGLLEEFQSLAACASLKSTFELVGVLVVTADPIEFVHGL